MWREVDTYKIGSTESTHSGLLLRRRGGVEWLDGRREYDETYGIFARICKIKACIHFDVWYLAAFVDRFCLQVIEGPWEKRVVV